jgi:uncharacterized protein (TIGR02996 family)
MSEQAGLLQAIVENPDELLHRLVYADWLEDHGEGLLAQFMRSQCTLRQFLVDPAEGARYPVAVEVLSLRPELRTRILAPFEALDKAFANTDFVLTDKFSFWVHRGMIEDIEVFGGVASSAFVRHAETIFAQVPLLRLAFSPVTSRQEARFFSPSGVVDVALESVSRSTVRALLRRAEIARLRCLDLRDLSLGNALGRILLDCPHPLGFQRLMLDGNQIEADVAELLRQRFGKALVLRPYDPNDDIPF